MYTWTGTNAEHPRESAHVTLFVKHTMLKLNCVFDHNQKIIVFIKIKPSIISNKQTNKQTNACTHGAFLMSKYTLEDWDMLMLFYK